MGDGYSKVPGSILHSKAWYLSAKTCPGELALGQMAPACNCAQGPGAPKATGSRNVRNAMAEPAATFKIGVSCQIYWQRTCNQQLAYGQMPHWNGP